MSRSEPPACSKCGRALDPPVQCANCGTLLCHYDIRVYEDLNLCADCYKDMTFQYRAEACDLPR